MTNAAEAINMAETPEAKLKSLGIELPEAAAPAANYEPFAVIGNQLVISGQLPIESGEFKYPGKLGDGVSIEDGKKAAKLCVLNILAHARNAAGGSLDNIKSCVRLGVFVNSSPDFTDQPLVANGASDFIAEVFGEKGKHARAAVGVAGLPKGVSVEVEAIFEI